MCRRYLYVTYSAGNMVCDFKLTWMDYISKAVDFIPKNCAPLQLQTDAGFFKKVASMSGVLYRLAQCWLEDYYFVKVDKWKLSFY